MISDKQFINKLSIKKRQRERERNIQKDELENKMSEAEKRQIVDKPRSREGGRHKTKERNYLRYRKTTKYTQNVFPTNT